MQLSTLVIGNWQISKPWMCREPCIVLSPPRVSVRANPTGDYLNWPLQCWEQFNSAPFMLLKLVCLTTSSWMSSIISPNRCIEKLAEFWRRRSNQCFSYLKRKKCECLKSLVTVEEVFVLYTESSGWANWANIEKGCVKTEVCGGFVKNTWQQVKRVFALLKFKILFGMTQCWFNPCPIFMPPDSRLSIHLYTSHRQSTVRTLVLDLRMRCGVTLR